MFKSVVVGHTIETIVVAVAAAEIHLQFASVAHSTIGLAEQTALEAVSVEAPGAVSVILQRLCHVPAYLARVATASESKGGIPPSRKLYTGQYTVQP
jgi:hypothetical protein